MRHSLLISSTCSHNEFMKYLKKLDPEIKQSALVARLCDIASGALLAEQIYPELDRDLPVPPLPLVPMVRQVAVVPVAEIQAAQARVQAQHDEILQCVRDSQDAKGKLCRYCLTEINGVKQDFMTVKVRLLSGEVRPLHQWFDKEQQQIFCDYQALARNVYALLDHVSQQKALKAVVTAVLGSVSFKSDASKSFYSELFDNALKWRKRNWLVLARDRRREVNDQRCQGAGAGAGAGVSECESGSVAPTCQEIEPGA